jgi:hypothetical protein
VSDLHWLVHQGHVIEFANGILETAKKPAPRPPKPEKQKQEAVTESGASSEAGAAPETLAEGTPVEGASAESTPAEGQSEVNEEVNTATVQEESDASPAGDVPTGGQGQLPQAAPEEPKNGSPS